MATATAEMTESIVDLDRRHVWHHLTQHKKFENADPLVFVEGKGLRITDINGKKYLDALAGGLWTVNVGYGRESIADAVRDQLAKLNFFAGTMGSIPAAEFSGRLLEKMPGMSRVYYATSGSEANEKVYKMVRQISHERYGGKKSKILYRERDYHGTTITTLSSCGHAERRLQYGPFTPDFVEVPHCLEYRSQYGDVDDYGVRAADEIEKIIKREGPETVGALVLEPVTAGGGIVVPPEGYWQRVQEICKKYDVLLHIDEVVCGFGRVGDAWFAYQKLGIEPDFVTMGKGVASGYAAIACTTTTERIFDMFKENPGDPLSYFRDVSTYGGCTGGPAAALENMNIMEKENLLGNSEKVGVYLRGKLHELKDKHEVVGDVRGMGLFAGIELVADRATKEPAEEAKVLSVLGNCLGQGVLIGATNRSLPGFNNTLVLSPALVCTESDVDEIVGAVGNALSEVFSG